MFTLTKTLNHPLKTEFVTISTKDLTKGTPWKVIALFSVPVLIGNIFQQLYNLVDTVIVGNTLGFHALGAVGSTGALSFLVLGFCNGLTAGFAVPVARCFGAKDYDKMRAFIQTVRTHTKNK